MKVKHLMPLITLVAATAFVSCKQEDINPIEEMPPAQWPQKRVSRIVFSIGTFDYLTYHFEWSKQHLEAIRCTYYDGTLMGGTSFEYDGDRLSRVFPFDSEGQSYVDGAMSYCYDARGRLERQFFLIPAQRKEHKRGEYYDVVRCELTYTYFDNGKVAEVVLSQIANTDTTTSSFHFAWNGDNVSSITRSSSDGSTSVVYNMQYDNHPNPLQFPMGVETMAVMPVEMLEGVLGYSVTFLSGAFCWCANNATDLISGTGHCSLQYDDEGCLISKTITSGGQSSTYTFTYQP